MYEKALRMSAKQQVALECLSYHARANVYDIQTLAMAPVPDADTFNLTR